MAGEAVYTLSDKRERAIAEKCSTAFIHVVMSRTGAETKNPVA